ncbi:MAG TPA: hypothetical protein VIW94_09215 [Acidimicrobiia bacterium]
MGGNPFTRIYRKRPSLEVTHPSGRPYETEAFHWGSLTTGHWLTSLWILLAPFALANVAGWMGVRRNSLQRASVRLAGLALTGLFVAQIGYVIVAVPGLYIEASGWGATTMAIARAVTGLGYVLVFGAVVLRLSIQSHFSPIPYPDRFSLLFAPRVDAMSNEQNPTWNDPAEAKLSDEVMWGVHTILHRLRRIHFATGQLVVALILARINGSEPIKVVSLVGLAVMAALIVATTYIAGTRVVLVLTSWTSIFGEAVALWAVATYVLDGQVLDLVAVHRTTFHMAIALGVAGAIAITGGIPGVGAITFATFIGGALGVGAGLVAEDLLDVGDLVGQGGAWVAPASLIFLLFVGLVAILLTFRGPPWLTGGGLTTRLLTRITRKSRLLLGAAAGFGLIVGGYAIVSGCILTPGLCQPDALSEFPGADLMVVALIASIMGALALRIFEFKRVAGAALALGAILVLWVGLFQPTFGSFDPAQYLYALPLSMTLIFIAPIAAIGRSVLGAYRQGASSRKVGVLWDVASFWPRWFHPLAPPAYGPMVVTALRDRISDGNVDILAGHSQGSVIAAIATQQAATRGGTLPTGLLTYGSPITLLYRKLFPDTGMDGLVADLPEQLSKGWINLWREDDPIGGEALGGNVSDLVEPDGSGHSGYELTKGYRTVRDRLS